MSKIQKLYRQLDALELEYARLLESELEKEINNRLSRYFSRRVPHLLDGKYWRDSATAHVEKVEKDIRALRAKLHESISDSFLAIMERFIYERKSRKDWHDGANKAVASTMLQELRKKRAGEQVTAADSARGSSGAPLAKS